MLGMMQVSKYVPFEDPFVLNTARAVYIGTNVFIALLYLYIQMQINKKKGKLYLRSPILTFPLVTPRD